MKADDKEAMIANLKAQVRNQIYSLISYGNIHILNPGHQGCS